MEYVGRSTRKGIEGQHTISGSVRAYEQETGVFKVLYDDGDLVEVGILELHKLLETPLELAEETEFAALEHRGNPGKRLKCVFEGPVNAGESSGECLLDLNKCLDLNGDGFKFDNGMETGSGSKLLDLNDGVSSKLNVDLDNNGVGMSTQRLIDLNVDVNEEVENLGVDGKRRDFDLNIELAQNETINLNEEEIGVHSRGDVRLNERSVESVGNMRQNLEREEEREDVENREMIDLNVAVSEDTDNMGGDRRILDFDLNLELVDYGDRAQILEKKEGNMWTNWGTGVQNKNVFAPVSFPGWEKIAEVDSSVTMAGQATQSTILPPKVELPPSSSNLDLNGVSSFGFLSVYAFLRSFSTMLFLSPFELKEFVDSVKSDDSTLLFDSIHVSLLRILRKHLESLSNKGSLSASNCLRSLNWEFLDLITWPMFVVEYLLLHSPGYIPGLDHRQSKPFKKCFYNLPLSAKVEILKHLCDDVVEAEVFRSEIETRVEATTPDMHSGQNKKFDISRRRKVAVDVASTSCITRDDVQQRANWNSEICCLCKMDGSLICCDGCPAAFHARCVGVVRSLLPEGDWYCPECQVEKDNPWLRMANSIRGASFLGIDPYGRRYHSSCGYLLVSESYEDKYSYSYYDRNDIPTLLEALESSPFVYDAIIRAIREEWNIVEGFGGTGNSMDSGSYSLHTTFPGIKQPQNMPLMTPKPLEDGAADGKNPSENAMLASNSCNMDPVNTKNVTTVETGNLMKMKNQMAYSEVSAKVSQALTEINNLQESGFKSLRGCSEIPDDDVHMLAGSGNCNVIDIPLVVPVNSYWKKYANYYQFASEISSLLQELASESSGEVDPTHIIEQKAISNRFFDFSWPNILNSRVNFKKEKCGWCSCCKVPEMGRDCLFITKPSLSAAENFTSEALGIGLRKNQENHLINVICQMICIEDHLRGLLRGPWLNANHSMIWRSSVAEVDDVASLKRLLLMMESNLHHLAFFAKWQKHVDTVDTMGSASYVVRDLPEEINRPELTLLWWRGGTVSRKLFNWKALPRSLVSKAARQGGCKKIRGVLYSERRECTRRAKYDVWRAAVESSSSVDQLALQIRELDANIRWDQICNTKRDKDGKRSVELFRDVTICEKISEGPVAKYLLDFSKSKSIPRVVLRHGTMLDGLSSNGKKYWLYEDHVPLHFLKAFEEKQILCKPNKPISGELHEFSRMRKKPSVKKGFSYLFLRAESLEKSQ